MAEMHPDSRTIGNSPDDMTSLEISPGAEPATVEPYDWLAALQRNEPWLRKVLFNRVGDRDAVDDLMQEIGLAISRPELRPQEEGRIGAWLYQVALRQAYLYRRKAGRFRRYVTGEAAQLPAPARQKSEDPLGWLLGREHRQAVRQAMQQLSDTDREILMLKYAENWTYQQLADRLGVTVHTIEHRLLKAKQRMRQLLKTSSGENSHD
jgi:RNA polymerase sigma-70 factor (ECF subfamily)